MQWEVTYYAPNEAPNAEVFTRFADAFAYSQPAPNAISWRYTRRQDIEGRFNNGENSLRVAWSDDTPDTIYVILKRL
jgi:hypothetical protein